MVNFKYIIPLFFLFSSCSISKELKEERESWDFKNWKQQYKDRAFCLCIMKGYENINLQSELVKNDKSFYNPLGVAIFDKSLMPLIDLEVKKIRDDSINSIDKYPEDLKSIYSRRGVISHCLKFYNGEYLDEL